MIRPGFPGLLTGRSEIKAFYRFFISKRSKFVLPSVVRGAGHAIILVPNMAPAKVFPFSSLADADLVIDAGV